ncbi:10304_t:CDS:2, partial [Paraglomus occultum]
MSTNNTDFNLPSYIKENITSIRNYLKQHDLESMKIEDSKLIVVKSNGIVVELRAAKDILSLAKEIIKVMIDDDLTEFISHPVSNIDDIRSGYYASLDEGGEPWTRSMSNFQRGCGIYYELVRLVVANTVGVGEYGEEWKRHIKNDVFH